MPSDLLPDQILKDRYCILGLLAPGGMSRVYVAEDLRLGRRVAIKLFDAVRFDGGPDADRARRRFFREARLAASLNHPNIVRVFDIDEVDGVPFLAMGLVEGKTLSELVKAGPPPDLSIALEVMLQVSDGLGFAHGRGVIHRDIKPSNIAVDADGRALLLDFGLAKAIDGSNITLTGQVPGTPPYLAPERLSRKEATPASDVFSAGITFFQYLTGRYPFANENKHYAIAFEEAVSPSALRPDISPGLEAVILKMLAKNPRDRYQSGSEVRRDLERVAAARRAKGEAGDPGEEGLLAWQSAAERTRLLLPFVGREPEIGALDAALAAAGAGVAGCMAIEGEAGMGKSRLVEELLKHARLRHVAAYVGRAVETGGHHPYQPFLTLLKHWAEQNRLRTAADLDRHVAERQPRLLGAAPVLKGLLAFTPAEPRDRDQLWESLSIFLTELAATAPALVVLEDLHLADAASLHLLRYLLLAMRGARLLLVVTYRPEGEAAVTLKEQAGEDRVRRLVLAPIDRSAAAELSRRLLVDGTDAARIAAVLDREARGHPLFIAEILKLLKGEGKLVPRGHGYAIAGDPTPASLPDGIRAVIRRRLERLSRQERDLLDIAAVLGEAFSSRDLFAVARGDRLTLLRCCQDLERSHHLIQAEPAGGFRFAHGRIRDVVYADLSEPLRREVHEQFGKWLAQAGTEERAPELAWHFEAAGQPAEAARWHRLAGSQAQKTFAYEDAAEHYLRALALDGEGDRVQVVRALAQVHFQLGALEPAEKGFRELTFASPEVASAAWFGLGKIALARGEGAKVIEAVEMGLRCLPPETHPAIDADLLRLRAQGHSFLGETELATADFAASLERARRQGDRPTLAQSLTWLARAHSQAGDFAAAQALLAEAEELVRSLDDSFLRARLLAARAFHETAKGEVLASRATLDEALRVAETVGGPSLCAMLHGNAAAAAERLGEFGAAREHARRAAEFGRATRAPSYAIPALINLLLACIESGDLAAAAAVRAELESLRRFAGREARIALDLGRGAFLAEIGRSGEAQALLEEVLSHAGSAAGDAAYRLGILALERDDPGAARALLEGSLLHLGRPGDTVQRGQSLTALARALAALGEPGAAQARLDEVPEAALASATVRRERAVAAALVAQAEGATAAARAALGEAGEIAHAQGAALAESQVLLAQARLEEAEDPVAAERRRQAALKLVAGVASALESKEDRETLLARPPFAGIRARLLAGSDHPPHDTTNDRLEVTT